MSEQDDPRAGMEEATEAETARNGEAAEEAPGAGQGAAAASEPGQAARPESEQPAPDQEASDPEVSQEAPAHQGPLEALQAQLAQAQSRCEQAETARQQVWERYLRLQADFDNFRRRNERERAEWQEKAEEGLIRELLPVLDNLERALTATPAGESAGDSAAQALATGVQMVYDQLCAILEKAGLQPVEAVGRAFDPRLHEAVDRVQAPGHEPDSVVEELQRGYLFRSKLIRPSMVRVAQVPEGEGGNNIG